jgi:hypothetical protein
MKKGGNHQSSALLYYLFEINYSAFRVKRLKSRTFSSGSAAANTSLTVFLASIILQSPNQKIPDRKTKCVIKTHINIKQNVIFGAKLKPV